MTCNADLIAELHSTGRLVHRDHYVMIKRQRLIEAANALAARDAEIERLCQIIAEADVADEARDAACGHLDEIIRLREQLARVNEANRKLRERNSTLAGMAGSNGMSPRVQRRYSDLRKATGGLSPQLVAKALDDLRQYPMFWDNPEIPYTEEEGAALRNARFEAGE
jgi:hypothetical protein